MGTRIPVLAPSEQTEGTQLQVLRWLKPAGATVVENEPLVEIETDKVTVEVPAPASGALVEILHDAGDDVMPGALLGHIATDAADETSAPRPQAASEVHGRLPTGTPGADVSPARAGSGTADSGSARRSLSPAVKRLLMEHALDAASVTGSGASGRITVDDVLTHVAQRAASGTGGKPARSVPPDSRPAEAAATRRDDARRVPHTSLRKRIAERMVESLLHTAPHVTTLFEADLGNVLEHRARHKAGYADRGVPLTLTAYFLKACVAAIREVPEANARWTDDALETYDSIDIGVGTALEDKGLVVPVVHGVQNLDLFGIAKRLDELVTRARDDRLTPADVRGGTFTISNHGVSGSLLAAPIVINQPQTAILGIGKLEKRPVVVERDGVDVVVVRPRCYVTLTIDHRVMDGHRANRFLTVFTQQLQGAQH